MQQTQIIYTASYYEDTTVNKKTPLLYLTVRIIYYMKITILRMESTTDFCK